MKRKRYRAIHRLYDISDALTDRTIHPDDLPDPKKQLETLVWRFELAIERNANNSGGRMV